MLAVKKLMLQGLLNHSFRGTTLSYSELLVALDNIIIVKATVPTARNRKIDTSAPMEIGVAAKDDGKSAREEGDQRIVDLILEAVYKRAGKGKWGFGKGESWNEKGYHGGNGGKGRRVKQPWHKGGKKGSKGQEKGGKGETRACWMCGKTRHIAAWCRKRGNNNLYATDEDDSENVEEATDNEKICKHGVCWKKVKMRSGKK